MKTHRKAYRGFRFPGEVISHGVWVYHRFTLSFRDVEELLAKRGIAVTHETIRQWCRKFGPEYARRLRRHQSRLADIWHLDEVFVKIGGERHYLWRAVDQDGDVIDVLVQRYRNARAAKRFLRKLLKGQRSKPWLLVTDKLRSYGAAHRRIMPLARLDARPRKKTPEYCGFPSRGSRVLPQMSLKLTIPSGVQCGLVSITRLVGADRGFLHSPYDRRRVGSSPGAWPRSLLAPARCRLTRHPPTAGCDLRQKPRRE